MKRPWTWNPWRWIETRAFWRLWESSTNADRLRAINRAFTHGAYVRARLTWRGWVLREYRDTPK